MDPINYKIDVGNPFANVLQGMQSRSILDEKQAAQQAAQQAAIAAQQQQAQMNADLAALSQKENPTAQDYARVATRYPQLADNIKKVWEPLNAEQKQNRISLYTQSLSAIKSGRPDIATDMLTKQAEALRNSGDEQGAASTEKLAEIIKINPKTAVDTGSLALAQIMGPDKFASVYDSLSKTPIEAERLGIETSNLPTKLQLEQQSTFEDIESKRLKRQLDVLGAQIARADSDTKREELQMKRDQKATELGDKQQAAQGALASVSQQLETINKIASSPMLKGGFGDVGSIFRPMAATVPGSESKDFDNLVETVKSQQFLSNLALLKAQGGSLGQVTEKEGERLEKSLASLDTNQSPEAFKASVNTIKKSLENIQRQIVAQGKLPTTNAGAGGAYVLTHPKYGTVTESTINNILSSKPGLTRAQVIEFLKSSGGR